MNENHNKTIPHTDNVCSFCSLASGGCPYDILHPPPFPCPDFDPKEFKTNTKDPFGSLGGEKPKGRKKPPYNSEYARKYYRKNKSQRKAYQQMYRDLNKDAIKLRDKIYNQTKRKKDKP